MQASNRIRYDPTSRSDESQTALAQLHVDAVVEEGRYGVADEGGEEDEGDYRVREVVVCFELLVLLPIVLLLMAKGAGDLRRELMPGCVC